MIQSETSFLLKGNQDQIKTVVQTAWAFINDSYCTTLCLQWEPEIIAIALMYLASKLSQFDLSKSIQISKNDKEKWYDQFVEGLNLETMEGNHEYKLIKFARKN